MQNDAASLAFREQELTETVWFPVENLVSLTDFEMITGTFATLRIAQGEDTKGSTKTKANTHTCPVVVRSEIACKALFFVRSHLGSSSLPPLLVPG